MANLLLPPLRIIGWLLAMAIALAASSTSVVYAYRYGVSLAASEPQPWVTGMTLAIADVVKIGLPAAIVALWARSHKAMAGTLGGVFVMLLGLSLWASTSITTIERATNDAKIASASKIEADLRAELAAAESRIVDLGSPPPLLAVEAEIDGFRGCALAHHRSVQPSSRESRLPALLRTSGVEAERSRKGCRSGQASRSVGEIRHILTTPSPDVGHIASPELAVIASVFGWRPESIGLARAVFFAVALELLGAFVPSACWFLRPAIGERSMASSHMPRPVSVADISPNAKPRPQKPVPSSPSRSNAKKQVSGKRGRKRDPNVLDFVRKFRERHGRSPNIPEMRAVFPSLHKSTLWRAARVASESDNRPHKLTA